MSERAKGVLKFFNKMKGYGFITSNGVDYFFHITQIKGDDEISEGDRLEFDITQTSKGFSATNVTIIKEK